MKITIFGATGGTGRELTRQAVERGHEVTVYVRDPAKLGELVKDLAVIVGSLEDECLLSQAVGGADVVISALGTFNRKPNTVLSDGTRRIVEAIKQNGGSRFAAVTSMGCGDSKDHVNSRIMRFIMKTFAKEIWADKNRQEDVIRNSGLDYLIVRPGGLTYDTARGSWTELRGGESYKGKQMIPRADVAAYILDRIEKPEFGNDCLTLF